MHQFPSKIEIWSKIYDFGSIVPGSNVLLGNLLFDAYISNDN